MTQKNQTKRNSIRFPSDENTLVWITKDLENTDMENSIFGLSVNESRKGVSVVTLKCEDIIVGENYLVKVGHLAPGKAELRWVKELDEEIIRLGFFFENY